MKVRLVELVITNNKTSSSGILVKKCFKIITSAQDFFSLPIIKGNTIIFVTVVNVRNSVMLITAGFIQQQIKTILIIQFLKL